MAWLEGVETVLENVKLGAKMDSVRSSAVRKGRLACRRYILSVRLLEAILGHVRGIRSDFRF